MGSLFFSRRTVGKSAASAMIVSCTPGAILVVSTREQADKYIEMFPSLKGRIRIIEEQRRNHG